MNTLVRTHVILPGDVLAAVDRIAGERKRSEFLAIAAEEKLKRIRLETLAHKLAGTLGENHIPEWKTSRSAASWVRALRKEKKASE